MTKINKKAIFAEYGIEWRGKNGGQILTPWGDWIALLMPIGTNSKVGDAATFSTKHGNKVYNIFEVSEKVRRVMELSGISSIKASCPCHCKGCYCDNGFFNMPSVNDGNMIKLIIATVYPDFLKRALIAQIKAYDIKQVRIHASGDFSINDDYINVWVDVANTCPGVIFWTYTKDEKALKAFKAVYNIKITPSITPYGFNFGTCGELLVMYEKLTKDGYKVHICGCGTPYEKHCSDCKHGCKAINNECDFVLFIKHSTKDYTAGKDDPNEYKAVCEIIARQNN